jgi:hypothetical protein
VRPGREHDTTAARADSDLLDDIAAWVDDGQLGLADLGYEGAADLLRIPIKKPTHGELTVDQQANNAVHGALRCLGERANSLLKTTFKALRRWRGCPWRIGQVEVQRVDRGARRAGVVTRCVIESDWCHGRGSLAGQVARWADEAVERDAEAVQILHVGCRPEPRSPGFPSRIHVRARSAIAITTRLNSRSHDLLHVPPAAFDLEELLVAQRDVGGRWARTNARSCVIRTNDIERDYPTPQPDPARPGPPPGGAW